jgi:hypothetical protein
MEATDAPSSEEHPNRYFPNSFDCHRFRYPPLCLSDDKEHWADDQSGSASCVFHARSVVLYVSQFAFLEKTIRVVVVWC